MDNLIASVGSNALLGTVVVSELLSLLTMLIVLYFYRVQIKKYRALLVRLGNESGFLKVGRVLLPLYVFLTVILTIVTILLYLFQPHLL